MGAALLTAFFFACSGIFSQRATLIFGSIPANFFRLAGACLVLSVCLAVAFPDTVHQQLLGWFLLSGALGFGLGDILLFLAYPRLGSRVALLIQFCVSVLTGAVADYFWLGTALRGIEILAIFAILLGLGLTLSGKKGTQAAAGQQRWSGVIFALGSAVSMGLATTISRVAQHQGQMLGLEVPPLSQAWQRILAGMTVAGLAFAGQRFAQRKLAQLPSPRLQSKNGCNKAFWLGGTMLIGPVIGVSCYQWALGVTGSSAVVLAVAATSALMIIPLARWLEKDHASREEICGSILAIGAVGWLCWLRR